MSLTLAYIITIIGLCCLGFLYYKFSKIFIKQEQKYSRDANSNTITVSNKNTIGDSLEQQNNNNEKHYIQQQASQIKPTITNDVWSIPGPVRIPFFGTKWIYLWKYKLSKIHEVYRGKDDSRFSHSLSILFSSLSHRLFPFRL